MTLKELSKITGYSVSTLSKIFSDSKEVSKETKNAVIIKAKELGCYYKFNKIKYDKKVIAVICPELSSAYYTNILSALKNVIEIKNATMIVAVTEFSLKEEVNLIGYFSSLKRADGIIVLEGKSVAKKHNPVPVVYMNSASENIYADTVNTDFYSGISEAIYEFKNNGHKKIGFIGEKLAAFKLDLFYKAMNHRNMPINENYVLISDERFEEAGYSAMEKMIKSKDIPTAILTAYDYIALGAIHFMQSHGLRCPDDISVIGMDNIKIASYYNISLSSINTNAEEMSSLMIDLLFRKIENRAYTLVQNISVKSNLIMRGSVKSLNAE